MSVSRFAPIRSMECLQCHKVMPRWELPHHIREKHVFISDSRALRARNFGHRDDPHRPPASPSPKVNLTSIPSESSNTLSTESDLSLSTIPTTQFSVWQQHNPVRPPAPTTIDDIALSRNHRTDSPQTSTQHLRNSVRFQVQDLVDEFEGLDAAARQVCIKGVRCMPIFPTLYAHVFTHLNLCAPDKPNLLIDLENMRREWTSRDKMWCLVNFKAIKDALSGLMSQAQVKLHICNRSLISQSRLHALDIQDIGALIASCSTDSHATSQLVTLKDDNAQFMLDLLQTLLVMKSDQLEEWYKCRFLDTIIRLSRRSGHFPQSLQLRRIENLEPTSLRGGSGVISKGELLGRLVAVKEIQAVGRTTEQFLKDFSNEAVVWCHIQHDCCLPFYGVFHLNDGAPKTCLVSPWMKNGHLNAYLQRTDADRAPLILDIARGLEYLHGVQPTIVHGDLKGANILVSSSGRACLADFGLATTQDSQAQLQTNIISVAGTPSFMAPELLEARANPRLLSALDRRPCDIFAFGCICYEMYDGLRPFWDLSPQAVDTNFMKGSRPSRPTNNVCLQRGLDDDMWDFIQNLWHQDPKLRATASQASLWMSHKMHMAGKSTDRPPAEMEWDLDFLTECIAELTDFDPLSLS
ncbi:kinase-like domain-containing protein [Suillus discolor]|uniref:Kinase-like domain-containing protein n=1 Tax=Suillus discolor TaxID=1912936 RepID=A0A9P7F857_9AGAM|nr:kinase-like domain-containing protein [Suillus discolor]KAG2109972.1 kinase-like domain-containing protein [Suillus discolor]